MHASLSIHRRAGRRPPEAKRHSARIVYVLFSLSLSLSRIRTREGEKSGIIWNHRWGGVVRRTCFALKDRCVCWPSATTQVVNWVSLHHFWAHALKRTFTTSRTTTVQRPFLMNNWSANDNQVSQIKTHLDILVPKSFFGLATCVTSLLITQGQRALCSWGKKPTRKKSERKKEKRSPGLVGFFFRFYCCRKGIVMSHTVIISSERRLSIASNLNMKFLLTERWGNILVCGLKLTSGSAQICAQALNLKGRKKKKRTAVFINTSWLNDWLGAA